MTANGPSTLAPPAPPQRPAPGAVVNTGFIAAALGAQLLGPADIPIRGGGTLDSAGPNDLTFIRDAVFAARWATAKAGAAIVTRTVVVPGHDATRRALLLVDDADLALIKILDFLKPPATPTPPGVHPSAIIDPSAHVHPSAHIGPRCSVGPRSVLGEHVVLHANVCIGADCRLGNATVLHPGVVLYDRVHLGQGCIVHANAVLGADGFGYRPDPSGRGLLKIPHAGGVEIHDQVEIGANACIDRGKLGNTIIGAGSKIDNLVQIGHNVIIGRACAIAACTGIAGSVTVGDGVLMGGHVGVADNLTIGRGARLGGYAAVASNVPAGQTWTGLPAMPVRDHFREVATLRRLAGTSRNLRRAQPPTP